MSTGQNERMFSELEIDALGEISNISMGSAATAVSTLLDRKVDITIPKVSVVKIKDIDLGDLEPALGVEISYIKGISGTNVMVLNKRDINTIVNIMTSGMLGSDPDAEIDEMSVSAICEIMNQMMGSSATALSNFLNRVIDISPPTPVGHENPLESLKKNAGSEDALVVLVKFNLDIEDAVHSQFFSIMTSELAGELVKTLLGDTSAMYAEPEPAPVSVPEPTPAPAESSSGSGGVLSQEEIEALLRGDSAPAPAPEPIPVAAPTQAPPVQQQPVMQQPVYQEPRVIGRPQAVPQETSQARPVELQSFDDKPVFYKNEQPENLELLRGVPLGISVEIGRTTKKIKEILELTQGSVVELNKQAGAQVDVMVNGQLIAKGDVVVIGDNFGVRITEIAKREELLKLQ